MNLTPWLSALLRASIPQDRKGRFFLVYAVISAGAIHFGRVQLANPFFEDLGYGFCMATLLLLLCLIALFFIILVLEALRYTVVQGGHPLPLLLLAGGFIVGFFLPVKTMEENIFLSHKEKYERLVELVRGHKLGHNGVCADDAAFVPPTGYEQLVGSESCVFLIAAPTLVVEFRPRTIYRPIMYFEDPAMVETLIGPCHGEGRVFKQMDDNWFICHRPD
jgi:hypothetical protein